MSKKPLLNEEVTRKFMKLAAIPTITRDKFLSETYLEEELHEADEDMPSEEDVPPEEGMPPEEDLGAPEAGVGDMEMEPADESAGTAEDLAEKIVDLLAGEGLVEKEGEEELPGEEPGEEMAGEEDLLEEEEELEEGRAGEGGAAGQHSHGRGTGDADARFEESIEVVDEEKLVESVLKRVLKRLA